MLLSIVIILLGAFMSVSVSRSSHSLNQDLEKAQIPDPINTQSLTSNNRFQLGRGYLNTIQTVRCLSIIGIIISIALSVLIPTLLFTAAALTTCVLKNRVKEKDLQVPEAVVQNAEKVAKSVLNRSESTASRTSANSQQSSKSWSSRSPAFFSGERRESVILETALNTIGEEKEVKEAFFNCIDHQEVDLKPQYFDLLKLSYFSLLLGLRQDPASVPRLLDKGTLLKASASGYLENKLEKYAKKEGNVEISVKPDKENKYAMKILEGDPLKDQENILEKLRPSEKFDLIADIYDKLVDQESKLGATEASSHFKENANHARLYAQDCREHELKA